MGKDGGWGGCEDTEIAGDEDEFRLGEATGEDAAGNVDQDGNSVSISIENNEEEKSYDGVNDEGGRGSNNSAYHEHRRENANTENEGGNFEIKKEIDAGPLSIRW